MAGSSSEVDGTGGIVPLFRFVPRCPPTSGSIPDRNTPGLKNSRHCVLRVIATSLVIRQFASIFSNRADNVFRQQFSAESRANRR
jgi:hypothetical protein